MRDQVGLNDKKAPLDGRGSESSKKEKKKRRGKKKGKEAEKEVKRNIKTSERYNEEDADITIISSDGTAFKVHSFLLLRAS
jgi:ribose 1,5-bisphosphokinase PhnN